MMPQLRPLNGMPTVTGLRVGDDVALQGPQWGDMGGDEVSDFGTTRNPNRHIERTLPANSAMTGRRKPGAGSANSSSSEDGVMAGGLQREGDTSGRTNDTARVGKSGQRTMVD